MFLLAAASAPAAEESPPIPGVMASSKLEVRFDAKTHEPREIVNRRTKERLDLVPESSFRLELVKLTEKQRLTSLVGASRRPSSTLVTARRGLRNKTGQPGLATCEPCTTVASPDA